MAAITHRLRCEVLEARRLTAVDVVDSGLNVSVQSDGIAGLRAAEIRLSYNPRELSLSENDIQVGKAWEGTAGLVTKVDEDAGSVNIFLFSAEPIAGNGGPLVDVKFQVVDEVVADVALATLSRVQLNEGAIESSAQIKPQDVTVKADTGIVPAVTPTSEVAAVEVPAVAEVITVQPVPLESIPAEAAPEMAVSQNDHPLNLIEPAIALEASETPKACGTWITLPSSDSPLSSELQSSDIGPAMPTVEPAVEPSVFAAPPVASSHWAIPLFEMRSFWNGDPE